MNKYLVPVIAGSYLIILAIFAIVDESVEATAPIETAAEHATPEKAVAKVEHAEEKEEAHEEKHDDDKHADDDHEKADDQEKADAHKDDSETHAVVVASDETIAAQREALAKNTEGKGFGPQSPRDIDSLSGNNPRTFAEAPAYTDMNLCNIHFHKNAEHKGGEFTFFAGNGDGKGYQSGYKFSGEFDGNELAAAEPVCPSEHGSLEVGDTIEVHYVHTSAQVKPGPTLGACLSDAIGNPQFRVEAQVYVLVNDDKALDFVELAAHGEVGDLHQALNIPTNTGAPVQYAGSTTGPGYNEKGSPYQVTWSVRPKVAKVSIASVGKWCEGNSFDEDHAHGVRNLVINPDLLSEIR